jgi:hypothetical protein
MLIWRRAGWRCRSPSRHGSAQQVMLVLLTAYGEVVAVET